MGLAGSALVVAVAALGGLAAPPVARACGTHGNAGSDIQDWIEVDADGDGTAQAFIGIPDMLVDPGAAETCICGIGLGSDASPLPPGVVVTAARLEVVNRLTAAATPLAQFAFAADPETTAGLAAGAGPGAPAGANPLFPGSTWFGFSAAVTPFSLTLGPDEYVRLGFDLDVPTRTLPFLIAAQFAAGGGNPDGSPAFGGTHPPSYFTAADPTVRLAEAVVGLSADVLLLTLGLALPLVYARVSGR